MKKFKSISPTLVRQIQVEQDKRSRRDERIKIIDKLTVVLSAYNKAIRNATCCGACGIDIELVINAITE